MNPAGSYEFWPVGADSTAPMRVELTRSNGTFEGWAQLRAGRPRRPIHQVIVGDNEVWVVIDVPGGVLDLRLIIEGGRVSGSLREELEEVPVTGRHVSASS